MARLTGTSIQEIQEDRLLAASKAAFNWNVVVVLKGARTVVKPIRAVPFYINPTGVTWAWLPPEAAMY